MVRTRLVVPLVALIALAAAAPALAQPGVSKAESRMISNLIERWVNDVVRGRNLADGWKIAGAAERGGITHKQWLSGRLLPVQQMRVLNNPRTAWWVTGRSGNEIFLTESLRNGHGKYARMYENNATLQKLHGRWYVYAFYTEATIRPGGGHSGSCVSSKCKVTGMNDYKPGGAVSGNGGATAGLIGTDWGVVVFGSIVAVPFLTVLTFALVAVTRSRKAKRARIAYEASRAT